MSKPKKYIAPCLLVKRQQMWMTLNGKEKAAALNNANTPLYNSKGRNWERIRPVKQAILTPDQKE